MQVVRYRGGASPSLEPIVAELDDVVDVKLGELQPAEATAQQVEGEAFMLSVSLDAFGCLCVAVELIHGHCLGGFQVRNCLWSNLLSTLRIHACAAT